MELQEGVHFSSSVNIANLFRASNPRCNSWARFSLVQTVYGLLGENILETLHSSVVDAQKSMKLFLEFGMDQRLASLEGKKLFRMSFHKRFPQQKPFNSDRVALMTNINQNAVISDLPMRVPPFCPRVQVKCVSDVQDPFQFLAIVHSY
jgi:hypothetical protein